MILHIEWAKTGKMLGNQSSTSTGLPDQGPDYQVVFQLYLTISSNGQIWYIQA